MSLNQNIFFSFECLTEKSPRLNGLELQQKWFRASDKRYMGQTLQKLIDYNSSRFRYLAITPFLEGSDKDLSLSFRSENYVGAIPIRSSENGKPIGDLIVFPRFTSAVDKFKEYTELIHVVGDVINPEFDYQLELKSSLEFKPPLYLEAVKFVDKLFELTNRPWKKFKSQEVSSNHFKGNIRWNKLVQEAHNPEKQIRIPTKYSRLTQEHTDYSKVKYVLRLAIQELLSERTPIEIKNSVKEKIIQIEIRLKNIPEIETDALTIGRADFLLVREVKLQANVLLLNNARLKKAWRVDYSQVFERTVQYLFTEVSKEIGGSIYLNHKIQNKRRNNFNWELNFLEPDLIYLKRGNIFYIDAKYKSHLLNKYSSSDFLKQEFRKDVHQILAYSSFSSNSSKQSFLCYPASSPSCAVNNFHNSLNSSESKIIILGIPLDKSFFTKIKQNIKEFLTSY